MSDHAWSAAQWLTANIKPSGHPRHNVVPTPLQRWMALPQVWSLQGVFVGMGEGAGEPCWIDANSFALRSSALRSACVAFIAGILWAGAGCVT
jgi:hypothetical protein